MSSKDKKVETNSLKKSLIFTHDKLVPLVICVFGSTFQVLTLFALYFSFPTTTLIDLYRPSQIILPSVSLCFLYHIDEIEIVRALNARNEPIGFQATSFDLTLDELDRFTPKVDDYIESCEVANASIDANSLFNFIDCADVRPVNVAMSPFLKCFTWFAYMEERYQYNRNDYYDDPFLVMRVNSNQSITRITVVLVHDNDEEVAFSNGSPEMTILDFNLYNKFIMTYYTKSTTQLSSPYSNCLDYVKTFGSSKRNLIKNCMYTDIYQNKTAFHERALISTSSSVTNVTFDKGIEISKYRSDCENKYPQEECEYRLFEVKTLHSEFDPKIEPGIVSIQWAFPLGLQSNVTMVKKLNDIEFFCYVASIISLWLEISMLTVAKFLFHHLRKIVLKILRRKAIEKKRSQLKANQRKKNTIQKTKVLNSKPKVSWISNIYDQNGLKSVHPKYSKAFGPRYPIPYYYY